MAITSVGSFTQAHNSNTFSLTTSTVGDLLVFAVANQSNSTVTATALSSSHVTWTLVSHHAGTNVSTTDTAIFVGKVTSATTATVTITWSGTAPAGDDISGHEFSVTSGDWSVVSADTTNIENTTDSWPSVAAGSGNLLFGFANNAGAVTVGSTSGYTYSASLNNNGVAFNPNCPSGSTAPAWGDSNAISGLIVVVQENRVRLDASTPAWSATVGGTNIHSKVTSAGNVTQQSASFSPPANSLVAVLVNSDYNNHESYTATGTTVADSSSNSYTRVLDLPAGSSGNYAGAQSIFMYYYSSAPGSITVTATLASAEVDTAGTGLNIAVLVFTGADTLSGQTGGSPGSNTFQSTASTTEEVTLSTTKAGSMVVFAGWNGGGASVTPIGSGAGQTTTYGQLAPDPTTGACYFGYSAADTGTPGSTTFGGTVASAHLVAAGIEILPASTGASSISLSDSGSGSDALAVTATVPLADSGSASDALTVQHPQSDSGTGSDTLAVTATVPLADAGVASDALAVTASIPLADTGAGSDAAPAGLAHVRVAVPAILILDRTGN
jgi:hypothetical protein